MSFNCDCLIHPFQNDPGTSQQYRIMDELLSGAAKIDARTLADLLDYFVQLSQHVNYYDLEGDVSDWQPFFKNSLPFALAAIIRHRTADIKNDFALHNSLFDKRPVPTGLQLNTHFLYFHFIYKINDWHLTLKDSGLPIVSALENMVRDKLQEPVKKFISYANAAVSSFGIKRIDFIKLYQNKIWNIDLQELYILDRSFDTGTKSILKNITQLNENFKTLFPVFLDVVKLLSTEAEKNLEQSLVIKKEELQKKHEPHLALLFAFLNIFRQLQNDLNQFTRRHLDFFYKDILRFKSAPAVPDKAHVLFEIQTQLKKYILKKGLLVKGGKDEKKQEMLFSLDNEIAVTKTEIADKKTLFLNNQEAHAQTYVEGVYMATNAGKADGVDKDFQTEVKNFPTLGAKESKYSDPETKIIKPYPNARLGFILASPVLFLQGGTRAITVTIACSLDNSVCEKLEKMNQAKPSCCSGGNPVVTKDPQYPKFLPPDRLVDDINDAIQHPYLPITNELLKTLRTQGLSDPTVEKILTLLDYHPKKICCDAIPLDEKLLQPFRLYIKYSLWIDFLNLNFDVTVPAQQKERMMLDALITSQETIQALNVLFSGKKEWIKPSVIDEICFYAYDAPNNQYYFRIKVTIGPDLLPVTFYNKDELKEDFGTTEPVVKVELNDTIKIKFSDPDFKLLFDPVPSSDDCCEQDPNCCLLEQNTDDRYISLYHFFRNVEVLNSVEKIIQGQPAVEKTRIDVAVCSLKNFIVQNDDSLQDVNGPVYPFGVRPIKGSNFYIGSEEIFLKHWTEIYLNLNWKDKPADFLAYYEAYQTRFLGMPVENEVKEEKFKIEIAVLIDGNWVPWKYAPVCDEHAPRKYNLFQDFVNPSGFICSDSTTYTHQYSLFREIDFSLLPDPVEEFSYQGITRLDVNTRQSFIRITLYCQDFQHDVYPFVLARQMMAFGKLPDDPIDGAVYFDPLTNNPIVFSTTKISTDVNDADVLSANVDFDVNDAGGTGLKDQIGGALSDPINTPQSDRIRQIIQPNGAIAPDVPGGLNLRADAAVLHTTLDRVNTTINLIKHGAAMIPKEPWTPIINAIVIDYKATAYIEDIDLIHLYPYKDTYKKEEIELQPTLFPTFCDEGTLFVGLSGLVPGDNLNILFQLAEATSDSESEKEPVNWHYLDNNIWKPLRKGFEVLNDATENLTTSGIVKLALPENMTKDNTVMPKNLHWIKASIAKNSKAVSETTGIHPQAMLSVFTNEDANDKLRLSKPLEAGSISKLNTADANIKTVQQPYESFDGRLPEEEGQFYVRVSETLRHKGRAIQPWDYERLTLAAFPQVFKAKCISHSFALDAHKYKNDFPYAPGYVILAVIPDLNKLKAGNSFEPKVPVSIIEKIEALIRKRISPFVRFRAMNPRFEKINFCIKVQLIKGKDENYYKEKLKEDLREFLAPWAVGEFSKLTFGQCVYRADIIRFLETRDYIDFITDLQMGKEDVAPSSISVVCPDTPRSILIAGDIEVCIKQPECDDWNDQYVGCGENPIDPCASMPEVIIDYCKPKRVQIIRNG